MSHCPYNFGENKIDTLPYFGELCLIFIFVPISPKSKNQHKFNYLNLLMLNETILEMPYGQLNFGKNNLKLYLLGGPGSWFPYLGPLAQNKKECHKLRYYGLLGVLNSLFAFSYPGGKDYDKNPVLNLCLLSQKCNSPYNLSLHVVYSIYYFLGSSKYVYLFHVFC